METKVNAKQIKFISFPILLWIVMECGPELCWAETTRGKDQKVARDHIREIPLQLYLAPDSNVSLELRGDLSYSHDLKGRPLAGVTGSRNLFRTSTGRILALTLNPNIRNSGKYQVRLSLRGEHGENDAAEISLDDREARNWSVLEPAQLFSTAIPNWSAKPDSPGFARPLNFGLQMQLIEATDGPKLRLVVWIPELGNRHREVALVSLRALYEWHAQRLLAPATLRLAFGDKTFLVEPIAGGAGVALHDLQDLHSDPLSSSPAYATLHTAGGRRIADIIPIADSNYELVWNPQVAQWEVGRTPVRWPREDPSEEVFARRKGGLVQVIFDGRTNTGVIAGYAGEILTCDAHLLIDRERELPVTVRFTDGTVRRGRAHGHSNKYDLAWISLEKPLRRLARIPCARGSLSTNQDCLVLRCPAGEAECSFEKARLAGLDHWQTDVRNKSIRNSQLDGTQKHAPGEAVLDQNGKLIGLTRAERIQSSRGYEWIPNVGLMVPLDALREFIQD